MTENENIAEGTKTAGMNTGANSIEQEPADTIQVGAGGALVVPSEDINAEIVDGVDMDIASRLPKPIRKPGRREWFLLHRDSELQTRLLIHRPSPESMDVEHYYVDKDLRLPIAEELKAVRVFQYYSLNAKSHGLWVLNVNPDNRWYESLNLLLRQDEDFFKSNAVRIVPDKTAGIYNVRHKPAHIDVAWAVAKTQELLGETLGAEKFIRTPDHPVYADLVSGKNLT